MAVKTFTDNTGLPASDINTYLNNGGLVYIKSQTIGSAVTSVSVTSAFSANYDNYLINVSGGAGSTNLSLMIQLGATTTNYLTSYMYNNLASTPLAVGTSTDTAFTYAGSGTTNGLFMSATVGNPYLAKASYLMGAAINASFGGLFIGMLNNTTSYTDFTLKASTGTITGGTITVYGYRIA